MKLVLLFTLIAFSSSFPLDELEEEYPVLWVIGSVAATAYDFASPFVPPQLSVPAQFVTMLVDMRNKMYREKQANISKCIVRHRMAIEFNDGVCRMFQNPIDHRHHCWHLPCRSDQTALTMEEYSMDLKKCCEWKEEQKDRRTKELTPEELKEVESENVLDCVDEREPSQEGLDLCPTNLDIRDARKHCHPRRCLEDETPLTANELLVENIRCCIAFI